MRVALVAFSAVALLVGCTSEVRKGGAQASYSQENVPLSDTSIFTALMKTSSGQGTITAVDGKQTSCWKAGCPACIRVLPGKHTFDIRFNVFNNGLFSYQYGVAQVVVEKMEPGHVYIADYALSRETFKVTYRDGGKDPDFVKNNGLGGVNFTCFNVTLN